jgi:lipopolysaccharide biosynthesis glycosyltransferase
MSLDKFKYSIVTEGSDLNFPYLRVMLLSLLKHNPWASENITILTCKETPLSDHNRVILKSICSNISYRDIDPNVYLDIKIKDSCRKDILPLLYRIEAFNFVDYDAIIYINSLSLCITSLDFVFKSTFDIMVSDTGHMARSTRNPNQMIKVSEFNTTLMLFSKNVLNKKIAFEILNRLSKVRNLSPPLIDSEINDALKVKELNIGFFDLNRVIKKSKFVDSKFDRFQSIQRSVGLISLDIGIQQKIKTQSAFMYKRMDSLWQSYNQQGAWHTESNNQTIVQDRVSLYLKGLEDRKIKKQIVTHENHKNIHKTKLVKIPNGTIKYNCGEDLNNKKLAIYTICNDSFTEGVQVMVHSFLRNNPWFKGEIVVLYNNKYSSLLKSNMLKIEALYNNITFKHVDESGYENLINDFKKNGKNNKNQLRLIPSLFTFEIFEEVKNYDTLVYLDSDMLITGDISETFNLPYEMVVTPDAGIYDISSNYQTFNGGFMVLNNFSYKNQYKNKLISFSRKMKNMGLADQTIMNAFFKGPLYSLDSNYNCLKRCFPDSKFHKFPNTIKIIHYVGAKPWTKSKIGIESTYKIVEGLWHEENKLISGGDIQHINREPKIDSVITKLQQNKLNVITSSCNDDALSRLTGKIMTTNWGISMALDKIDYYVCSTPERQLITTIMRNVNKVEKWFTTESLRRSLKNHQINWTNLFEYMRKLGRLGLNHMKDKRSRNGLNLPTSGVQMIYLASFMDINELNIVGVNLYTMKDKDGNYKRSCSTSKENPYEMQSKPHDIETDLAFIIDSFKRMMKNNVKITIDSDILSSVLDTCKHYESNSDIIKNIKLKYDF